MSVDKTQFHKFLINFPFDLWTRLKNHADYNGLTMTALIRVILLSYIEQLEIKEMQLREVKKTLK